MSIQPRMHSHAWSRDFARLCLITLLVTLVAAPSLASDRCASFGKTSGQPTLSFTRWCAGDGVAAAPASAAAPDVIEGIAATAYALNIWFDTGDFFTHPVDTMASLSFVGTNSLFITGYDFSPDGGTLWALNRSTDQFGTMDLSDSSFTAIGAINPPAGEVWTSLVADPVSGTIYAISLDEVGGTSTLLTVDPGTGGTTLVGPISVDILGAAMNCDGEMYGISLFQDNTYKIDPATGTPTLMGSLGIDLNFAQDIDFDNETGVLYHWAYDVSNGAKYGSINTSTGAFTEITDLGSSELYVGTVRNSCNTSVFTDGFESGDTSAWSVTVN